MRAGDVVRVEFGVPIGSAAGFVGPAVVVSADEYLSSGASTVTVVPVTSTDRYPSDVPLEGRDVMGVAQCRLITTVARQAVTETGEHVDAAVLNQVRSVLSDLLDIE